MSRRLSSPSTTARTRRPLRPAAAKFPSMSIVNGEWTSAIIHSPFTIHHLPFTAMTVYDARAISEIIPHRYPFLLVDRIIELVPGTRIVGIKQVTIGEPFFQGHFPGAPVMPGVLIVEAMAQVGAVYALSQIEDRDKKLVLFSGIDNARFRRPVVPGDTLILEVTPV